MAPFSLRPAFQRLLTGPFLVGTLLGCSHAAPDTPAAAEVTAMTKPRTFGTQVDSLNGVPGHHFGEPLSAFVGLVPAQGPPTAGLVGYHLPDGSSQQVPWFAKHQAEVPGVFYLFREGKFATFQAIAYSPAGQAALMQEAAFLFGPGRQLGDRTEWAGERAWAVLSTSYLNARVVKVLKVASLTLQAEQERHQQARLKAENAAR